MRKKYFIGIIASGLIVACMAVAANAADCGCGGMSKQSYNALSGPPCYSPPGCYLAPGCCECPPSPCDNAWAGYCQHKARVQAYFAKVGTPTPGYLYGHSGHCYRGCGAPTPAVRRDCESPTVKEAPSENIPAPKPAVSPEPSKQEVPLPPTPEKVSRAKVLYPWMR